VSKEHFSFTPRPAIAWSQTVAFVVEMVAYFQGWTFVYVVACIIVLCLLGYGFLIPVWKSNPGIAKGLSRRW